MPQIESKDIFRAAYLLTEGFSLAETRLDESRRVIFILQGKGLLEADSRYRSGQALSNPLRPAGVPESAQGCGPPNPKPENGEKPLWENQASKRSNRTSVWRKKSANVECF